VTICEREAIITFVAAYRAGVEKNILPEAVIFSFQALTPAFTEKTRKPTRKFPRLRPGAGIHSKDRPLDDVSREKQKGQKIENDKTVAFLALPPFLSFSLHPLPSSSLYVGRAKIWISQGADWVSTAAVLTRRLDSDLAAPGI
jgi:hypothetical protein